CQHGYGTPPAF
nr:immunoglobulin light chain junction region [Macaca mulatta]MPN97552.1 immunoglobulin light chain junction region [Macaca mulatta]